MFNIFPGVINEYRIVSNPQQNNFAFHKNLLDFIYEDK